MELPNLQQTAQLLNGVEVGPIYINVAKDYSRFPGGRYREDGPGNATEFREKFLVPILENHQRAIIDLDDAIGYPASFLDEAFGGLISKHGFDSGTVLNSLEFKADRYEINMIVPTIIEYIKSASNSRAV